MLNSSTARLLALRGWCANSRCKMQHSTKCRHHCCQQAKEALVNVSHAYTLDHQQEEQLLQQTHRIILALKDAGDSAQLRQLAGQLHRMSAALRASLEQHVQV